VIRLPDFLDILPAVMEKVKSSPRFQLKRRLLEDEVRRNGE